MTNITTGYGQSPILWLADPDGAPFQSAILKQCLQLGLKWSIVKKSDSAGFK